MTVFDEIMCFLIFFSLANGLSCFVGFVYGANKKIGVALLAFGIFAVAVLVVLGLVNIATTPSSYEFSYGSGVAGFVSAWTAPECFGIFKRKAKELLGDKKQ